MGGWDNPLCAGFDANGSMGAAALSFDMGFWAGASIPVGLAACLFLTALFFAKPMQRMNLMTLPDFYSRTFSIASASSKSVSL